MSLVLPILTFVCGMILIASAFYNQWLWASETKPTNELSRTVLSIQMSMVMALLALMLSNFVSVIIQSTKKQYKKSMIGMLAASFAIIALCFTMAYDQASVFYQ